MASPVDWRFAERVALRFSGSEPFAATISDSNREWSRIIANEKRSFGSCVFATLRSRRNSLACVRACIGASTFMRAFA